MAYTGEFEALAYVSICNQKNLGNKQCLVIYFSNFLISL
jgi:hypothetical protein